MTAHHLQNVYLLLSLLTWLMSHYKDSIHFTSSTDLNIMHRSHQDSSQHWGHRQTKLTLYDEFERFERSGVAKFEKYLATTRALSFGELLPDLDDTKKNSSSNDKFHSATQHKKQQLAQQESSTHSSRAYLHSQDPLHSQEECSILANLEKVALVTEIEPPFHPVGRRLSNASLHSDNAILGDVLKHQQNQDTSWENMNDHNKVDEYYNVEPLRNPIGVHYPQQRDSLWDQGTHRSRQMAERRLSPGQYFGARSLPLKSIQNLWNEQEMSYTSLELQHFPQDTYQSNMDSTTHQESHVLEEKAEEEIEKDVEESLSREEISIQSIPKKNNAHPTDPLWTTFKTLPETLQHCKYRINYNECNSKQLKEAIRQLRQKKKHHPINISPQQNSVDPLATRFHDLSLNSKKITRHEKESRHSKRTQPRVANQPFIVQPDRLILKYTAKPSGIELRDAMFEIINTSHHHSCTFSLFSSRGRIAFSPREGVIPCNSYVTITARIRENTIGYYLDTMPVSDVYKPLPDTLLVLIEDKHPQKIQAKIHIQSMHQDSSHTNSESSIASHKVSQQKSSTVSSHSHSHTSHPEPVTTPSPQKHSTACRLCSLERCYP
ncbi:hypothetical protein BDF14DRAFT_1407839 [Spinellus fusiger]|nr:hypothetical protein BDF14DRAFT_1407839 [Spinellus fusiger]